MLKTTPPAHPDYATLQSAIALVKQVVIDINTSKRLEEQRLKLVEVAKKIDGCQVRWVIARTQLERHCRVADCPRWLCRI